MKVDLGCGKRKRQGFIGIDIRKFKGVDFVLDLEKADLPFPDDFVDLIVADHLFEHFTPDGLFHCIDECWRVLKPKGFLYVKVPKAGTKAFYLHPDHKIQFIEDTFGFFQVPAGKDPHGYLKYFWHINILKSENPEAIRVRMYPNKKGGKFKYKEV